MTWRSTAVYLCLLLIVGGIYFYMSAEQKETARKDKESRRVFSFDPGSVKSIEINSGKSDAIDLEKDGDKWRISKPIASDVDKMTFSDFFSTLQNLERERVIAKAPENPGDFGLDNPSLVVRLVTGDNSLELRVGATNPAETSRYAKTGENGDIFLVSSAAYDSLSKSLKDFRKKELFSWQPDQVSAVDVKWRDGDAFSLERQGGEKQWKLTMQPDVQIKPGKVQNMLDDLHWMRASGFVGKEEMPPSALLDITLKLKDGKTSELKVANPDDTKKQAVATSSELDDPVLLASSFVNLIPRSAASLVDRSLISPDAADIRTISWKTDNGAGNLIWMDGNSWGKKDGDSAPKALENQVQVRGFLASVGGLEYDEAAESGAAPPETAANRLEVTDVFGKKFSITWNNLPQETAGPVNVWITRDGAAREVKVQYEKVKKINDLLAQLKID